MQPESPTCDIPATGSSLFQPCSFSLFQVVALLPGILFCQVFATGASSPMPPRIKCASATRGRHRQADIRITFGYRLRMVWGVAAAAADRLLSSELQKGHYECQIVAVVAGRPAIQVCPWCPRLSGREKPRAANRLGLLRWGDQHAD